MLIMTRGTLWYRMSLSIWDRSFCYNLERLLLHQLTPSQQNHILDFHTRFSHRWPLAKGNQIMQSWVQLYSRHWWKSREIDIMEYQDINLLIVSWIDFSFSPGALNNNVYVIVFPTNRFLFSSMYKLVKLVHSVHRDQCSFNDILKQVATKVCQNS